MCAPTRRWKDPSLPGTWCLCRRYAAQPPGAAVAWVLPAAALAELVLERTAAARHVCLAPERGENESDGECSAQRCAQQYCEAVCDGRLSPALSGKDALNAAASQTAAVQAAVV